MIEMTADDENTTTDGEDFVILHKISVFFPRGQNLDRPSITVRGIVSDKSMSNNARIVINRSLVLSLTFRGRTKRLSLNDSFVFIARLFLILCNAIITEEFDEMDVKINDT